MWPVMAGYDGSITLTQAQLAVLIEGIDWRAQERVWRPKLAGLELAYTAPPWPSSHPPDAM